ncbi:hypothetical protein PHAVU_010G045100 [Phaseolus vulgaris]|uniref:Uncharacterized protein n=1 Tax=Phaseolus vulgaris TaxID=3885 RepID=V7ALK9_PHAVU|nr:hypothetical protein PHAVU_010G045100g [Phaseolus vulgaris]ESW06399.1 hypothetical protein PHAVU_010G045100g [Phaseolus vulgaris]
MLHILIASKFSFFNQLSLKPFLSALSALRLRGTMVSQLALVSNSENRVRETFPITNFPSACELVPPKLTKGARLNAKLACLPSTSWTRSLFDKLGINTTLPLSLKLLRPPTTAPLFCIIAPSSLPLTSPAPSQPLSSPLHPELPSPAVATTPIVEGDVDRRLQPAAALKSTNKTSPLVIAAPKTPLKNDENPPF